MEYATHGGGCCGAGHVYKLGTDVNIGDLIDSINSRIQNVRSGATRAWETGDRGYTQGGGTIRSMEEEPVRWKGRDFGHLIEITLTDNQVKVWKKVLKEVGFVFHRRWFNDNSGNYVSLLSYVPPNVPNDPPPFDWDADEKIVPPDINIRIIEDTRPIEWSNFW